MDLLDLLWNRDQDRRLDELRDHLDQVRSQQAAGNPLSPQQLAAENLELKLRLGLLVRLLISKGVISAEEYAGLIAQSRPRT
jgi:hypothetical protein